MKKLTVFLFFLVLLALCENAKLPSTFKKCDVSKPDVDKCLSEAIKNGMEQLTTPIKNVGLPNMEPLEVPALVIGAGTGPVQFQQNYKNLKISGYTKINSLEATFKDNHLKIDAEFPEIKLVFEYEINGRILVLPISGKGPGSITMVKPKFVIDFPLQEYEKNGTKYYKIGKQSLSIEPQKMHFELENLFNGDKILAENVLQIMNDNWKEVYGDVQSSYEEAFGKIFKSIFDNFLTKVPKSDLFDGV
ncbi:protein takeout-like [Tribolium madens]|uniref:protein takeout-like n=1 Tax=Tribolium madens TaxID=41895 RepID=UPI001CF73254|nr:protein takeout-like [Tribolium madens]